MEFCTAEEEERRKATGAIRDLIDLINACASAKTGVLGISIPLKGVPAPGTGLFRPLVAYFEIRSGLI